MTWPPSQSEKNKLRELPAVPYLFGPEGENLYDSTAIGEWLVLQNPSLNILPPVDTAEGFMVRLIDESLDEFGLYIVHHNRWVHAATDNNAGERLAAEMRPLLGPLSFVLRVVFPRRQTRRLPYLFSVAGGGSQTSVGSQAPGRKGFPPTHQLLDQAFCELLSAL